MEGGENVDVGTSSAPCVSGDDTAAGIGEHDVSAVKESKKKNDQEEEVDGNDEDDDDDGNAAAEFVPGPLITLKEQLEKDKDDESLRRWKEKLLGCIDDINGQVEPEVVFHSFGIVSEGSGETIIPVPLNEKQSNILFTLKEGSQYRLKLIFNVQHNIVSGLSYSNMVWRGGLRVDRSKGMLGTFAPQRDPYVCLLEEETTPSGMLARGVYSAKLKFEDDDRRCHMELNYCFEIRKQ